MTGITLGNDFYIVAKNVQGNELAVNVFRAKTLRRKVSVHLYSKVPP